MIPAVLVYLRVEDKYLMIQRANRKGDIHSGKWNALGGKLEKGESSLQAAQRELHEESGILLGQEYFSSYGTIHFPNFKSAKNEDWMVSVFRVEGPKSLLDTVFVGRDEGMCHWVEETSLLDLPLWPGDRLFLPMLMKRKKINACIWYRDGEVEKSWIEEL